MGADIPAHSQDYSVFGLRVRSAIPLPELFPAEGTGEADVTISVASVREGRGIQPGLTAVDGGLLLFVPNVGRYRIELGSTITVELEPGVPARNLRLFLLGSAFGALLHQRGILPLHANAVELGGAAVAFMGESGAGKSTLAAWFHDQGCEVIADDVCAVTFQATEQPVALPGLPRLRLWRDALEETGRDLRRYARSYVSEDEEEKFDVPMEVTARVPVPLAALYVLREGERFALEPLTLLKAAEAVFDHTYRGAFVGPAQAAHTHWDLAVKLVRSIPVFELTRPRALSALGEYSAQVREHATQLATSSSRPRPSA